MRDDRDLLHARPHALVERQPQRRLLHAIAIDQPLQRQLALVGTGGGDHGFADLHDLRVNSRPMKRAPRFV
jgi:hypothetical protein